MSKNHNLTKNFSLSRAYSKDTTCHWKHRLGHFGSFCFLLNYWSWGIFRSGLFGCSSFLFGYSRSNLNGGIPGSIYANPPVPLGNQFRYNCYWTHSLEHKRSWVQSPIATRFPWSFSQALYIPKRCITGETKFAWKWILYGSLIYARFFGSIALTNTGCVRSTY